MSDPEKAKAVKSVQRAVEMPAVRTTIVGGRPPGCGKPLGDIPRGIEVLVKKASVDPAFRAVLLAQRARAADEIGLLLAPEEETLLNHVPAAQLEAIISRTRVDPSRRNAFLTKAAGVMLAALGASTVVSDAQVGPTKGIRLEPPPTTTSAPATQPSTKPTTEPVSRGVRPDIPFTQPAPSPATRPTTLPVTEGIRPAEGPIIRPANIPSPPGGARPDMPAVTGIRPDVPPPTPAPPAPVPGAAGAAANLMLFDPAGPATLQTEAPAATPPPPPVRVAGIMPGPTTRPARAPVVVGDRIEVAPPRTQPPTQPASQAASQPGLSPKEIGDLIKQLDDDQYPVREAAHQKLQGQGLAILPTLRERLKWSGLSAEVRSRLERIVTNLEATTRPVVRPEVPRAVIGARGIEVRPVQVQPMPAPAPAPVNQAPAPADPVVKPLPARMPVAAGVRMADPPPATQPAGRPGSQPTTQRDERPAVEGLARRFLSAMADGNTEAMKALSAGSVDGWIDEESLPEASSGEPPVGWSVKALTKVAAELRNEVFAKNPDSIKTIEELAVAGDFAATRTPGPKGMNNPKYLLLVFLRTTQGWRFAMLDDARGSLQENLAKHAERLRSLQRPVTTQPVSQPALSTKEIGDLLRQLDDDRFAVRDAAHQRLQAQGIAILPTLRETLKDSKLSSEVRSRLESIVTKLEATTKPVKRPVEVRAVRGVRAIDVE